MDDGIEETVDVIYCESNGSCAGMFKLTDILKHLYVNKTFFDADRVLMFISGAIGNDRLVTCHYGASSITNHGHRS